jgi:cellobiose phosphorylase
MNPFSNFTGSLAWYRRGIEEVAGVLADFAGLRIAPRAPSAWKSYRVVKNFRGCKVDARLKRGRKPSVRLNGQEVPPLIPAEMLTSGAQARVDVVYT